ncbi:Two-component, sigma54 specific, transcriptional regulator, Fis family [Desulfatibacillum aliphaticivorans]|uniref:Two-component, sigma54 specific, transcriptional regulator, Fis family n=1 Tax=Desulfatibacillum aliphaticivorans TaxID=218208 RepID=B8FEY3_DESAL|nr:sigma-54 dependent transcriptional regulator [Desulfatibacillum aliphaticivorans]ACL03660.1 Two-component, sigma54 specific, transcriptional regulator, Fis family [Desulfatibacillum aliphaticivorans]
METILIVDDEKNYPPLLAAVLGDEGYETLTANSGLEAIQILEGSDVDLVLTDMKMPGMDGMELMERIKTRDPDLPVLMMTAYGTVDMGMAAMEKGAYSYIWKPFQNEQLILFVKQALAMYRVVQENRLLKNELGDRYSFGNIIGKSPAMVNIFDTIVKVAPTNATVLIQGESGTGKEMVAKSIHFNSHRKDAPWVAVNCAALAESILESELFGHEKGAFTGAAAMKKGRFELADGGTLFLDEIGEISSSLQVKLLRVLQEKTFERVGGVKPIEVDIRLIAATNRDLKKEVENSAFREDLFYRLNVLPIQLPPLRERQKDIPLLVDHFLQKYASGPSGESRVRKVHPDVHRLFQEYAWPGNVRELENVIERAIILCNSDAISVNDLPRELTRSVSNTLHMEGIPVDATLYETLSMVEQAMIKRAMLMSDNVQSHAAQILGIGKSGLNQKIKKFGLDFGLKS